MAAIRVRSGCCLLGTRHVFSDRNGRNQNVFQSPRQVLPAPLTMNQRIDRCTGLWLVYISTFIEISIFIFCTHDIGKNKIPPRLSPLGSRLIRGWSTIVPFPGTCILIDTHVCNVCRYVRRYVRTYICMYVCMQGMYVCMQGTYICMHACM